MIRHRTPHQLAWVRRRVRHAAGVIERYQLRGDVWAELRLKRAIQRAQTAGISEEEIDGLIATGAERRRLEKAVVDAAETLGRLDELGRAAPAHASALRAARHRVRELQLMSQEQLDDLTMDALVEGRDGNA